MKKIKYSLFILLTSFLVSCDEDFLNTLPTDAVSEELVFVNTSNAWAALNGIHRSMYVRYDSQGQPGEGGVMMYREIMADDVVMTGQAGNWHVGNSRWLTHMNENAADVRFVWRFYYLIIANANMIIANIDDAEGPQRDKDEIKGQAYAYRAWGHWNLVQIFAERFNPGTENTQLGVPLALEPITEGGARNTVAEVYEQVHADLDMALSLLTERRNFKSHFNDAVVRGLKARVALSQSNFPLAAQLANQARQGYTLMSPAQLYDGFNDVGNPEWMWGSAQQDDQQTFFASFFAYMSLNFNSTVIRGNPKAINSALYAQIPDSDARKGLWDPNAGTPSLRDPFIDEMTLNTFVKINYMNRKFLAQANASSVGDVPYMRAAEMYLIEAEALARSGQNSAAQDVLFSFVSVRNPQYVKSTNTGEALINEIMIQRRIELWGEGFRWYDLKRLNLPLDRTGANHSSIIINNVFQVPASSNEWQWRIPISELNANPLMVQNPS
ncbi:RagB/SusD family nutrient uptake outer membrane protein [Belliella sp. DSM 111904]|uniref:RagB/SusD family nutrient uptake outer membrane protein n=1 Tax=Belliella filtrata TaxID=2923435 RepID=A0ABS9V4E2_9BACT|nr:RagB/SusD family nutrient uptake outer membrane protein [Belliella filtrata]MCH7411276.1 RagB/SusD family nutrient uptake outer membrane protein [Belliella filtrata]